MNIFSIHDLLFTKLCIGCQRNNWIEKDGFCVACTEKVNPTYQLENQFNSNIKNLFTKRFYGRIPIKEGGALYWFSKGDIIEQMVYSIKYGRKKQIGYSIGRILGNEIIKTKTFKNIDLIIPIPLHPIKKRKRGFNQSELIATSLSNIIGVKVEKTCLYKKENTISQTHKSRIQRLTDIADSFGIKYPEKIMGKHILLLDDVLTTGATLEAAAIVLLAANAKSISMVTIGVGKM